MLAVGKPCTSTRGGAPGVPHRRVNTATSRPPLASVVDRHRSSVPPVRHSSTIWEPVTGSQPAGMSWSISASHTVAAMSEGARQSPRGDSDPPCETFGPLGSAERLN